MENKTLDQNNGHVTYNGVTLDLTAMRKQVSIELLKFTGCIQGALACLRDASILLEAIGSDKSNVLFVKSIEAEILSLLDILKDSDL